MQPSSSKLSSQVMYNVISDSSAWSLVGYQQEDLNALGVSACVFLAMPLCGAQFCTTAAIFVELFDIMQHFVAAEFKMAAVYYFRQGFHMVWRCFGSWKFVKGPIIVSTSFPLAKRKKVPIFEWTSPLNTIYQMHFSDVMILGMII